MNVRPVFSSIRLIETGIVTSVVRITAPTMFWKPLRSDAVALSIGLYTFKSPSIHGTLAERDIFVTSSGDEATSEKRSMTLTCVLPFSSETPSGSESIKGTI